MHLFFNLLFIWQLGSDLEFELGRKKYRLLVLFIIIGTGLTTFIVQFGSSIPNIGSSAFAFGIMGAYTFLFPDMYILNVKIKIRYILLVFFLLEILAFTQIAHIIGFILGYLFLRIDIVRKFGEL